MKFIETPLEGLWIVDPIVHTDPRGYFMEVYNKREFQKHHIDREFVQDNISRSVRGALRGLHYQLEPYAQGKLVRVTKGDIFDVAVDIRRQSPTFGRWFGCNLSAENKRALYVPPGFAHGFCVLSEDAEFVYKCTHFYTPQAERCIIWNDPQIGIQWPIIPDLNLISKKDASAPRLQEAEVF